MNRRVGVSVFGYGGVRQGSGGLPTRAGMLSARGQLDALHRRCVCRVPFRPSSKGGISLESSRAECPEELRNFVFNGRRVIR
eukprot:5868686-Pleurochrysis_carterae.AAC.1